jgi:sugar diacid utilization regulator
MTQITVADLLAQGDRWGLRCVAGSPDGVVVTDVAILGLDDLTSASEHHLVIVAHPDGSVPRPYQVDIAIRRAIAAGCAGVVFVGDFPVAETSRALADRGGLPVLLSSGQASELAVLLDRTIRGGAEEAMSRAEFAIQSIIDAVGTASEHTQELILDVASAALGIRIALVEDASVSWAEPDAVCIGQVPIGRVVADSADSATAIALPVIASVLSRSLQRELQDRFGSVRSRADLIVEMIFAESSRIDGFAVDAVRAGLAIQLSHAVAWLTPTHRSDTERHPAAVLAPSIELFTLQLVDHRAEVWHLAMLRDHIIVVASEEVGAADHQRRLRDVMELVVAHASSVAGEDWAFTVGLSTPQSGASGLRQAAAEARIAAESAIAGGRAGVIEATDATGLRRVLLDFYASPLSRTLLEDILAPLDALGPERSHTSIQTLLAYIGHRNSLARAATALNLHPNAVNYRIRRIEQSLALDLNDPDVRFAVELACRVRLIAPARSGAVS